MTNVSDIFSGMKVCQDDLPDGVDFGGIVSIDTERMGLHPGRDRITVVQVFDIFTSSAYLVKVSRNVQRPKNLMRLFASSRILKLLHYALGDMICLIKLFGNDAPVRSVFCTKIMAKVALTFTGSHGLKSLASRFLKKDWSYAADTYWGGELNARQVHYAIQDVLYMHLIYIHLLRILTLEGRLRIFYAGVKAMNLLAFAEANDFSYQYILSWKSEQ